MLTLPVLELPKLVQPSLELEELPCIVYILYIVNIVYIVCTLHRTCGIYSMRSTWVHQEGTVFDWLKL